ncbi:MAG: sulfatase [Pirellulaceae bacterium]
MKQRFATQTDLPLPMQMAMLMWWIAGLVLIGDVSVHARCAADDTDAPSAARSEPQPPDTRPNVLMIAVDDLNDWVGCLGGHPQSVTPNLDAFAQRSVVFTNAHCQAPICNPSRISLLTGTRPSTTGIYYLGPLLRQCDSTEDAVTLPQHFARHGYHTMAAGKIFHVEGRGEFDLYAGNMGGMGPRPPKPISAGHSHPLWDWGAFPDSDELMPDAKIAAWASEQLAKSYDQPFFLACGFYRPHVPMTVPHKWFDLHPLDQVQLPAYTETDLDDVPAYGQDLSYSAVAPRHSWIVEHDEWRHAVQSYLASVTFVDAQVGKVLDALRTSAHADNTMVVIWSDHGFHLGTKQRWGKRSLWEDSTRVVLMMHRPTDSVGTRCNRPVELLDLFPTFNDLCQLPPVTGLEGQSLTPLLDDANAAWPWPAITSFGQQNHAVRTQNWRYIRYVDGSEELYDHRVDPHEWTNLAARPEYREVIREHRRWLPQVNQPMAPGSVHADARPGSAADIDSDDAAQ